MSPLYRLFQWVEPYVGQTFLYGGAAGALAAGFGWQPPTWLIGVLAFFLLAKEGYNDLKGMVEDEHEEGARA